MGCATRPSVIGALQVSYMYKINILHIWSQTKTNSQNKVEHNFCTKFRKWQSAI